MYYRSQGYRYPRGVQIPVNYGGNAFAQAKESDVEESSAENVEDNSLESESYDSNKEQAATCEQEAPQDGDTAPASLFQSLGSKSLFGGRIGSEELLILALVFLLSDTDSDNDIIWLLLLLFFIK